MKWPETLTLIRHDTSAYNVLKPIKDKSKLYQKFLKSYEDNPASDMCRRLALQVKNFFHLNLLITIPQLPITVVINQKKWVKN